MEKKKKTNDWDKLAAKYESKFTKDRLAQDRIMKQNLRYFLRENFRVIEVGSGTGYVSRYLAQFVKEYECFDTSDAMNKIATEKNEYVNVTIQKGDAAALPEKSDRFDAAVCFNLLNFTEAPQAVLAELHRVLKTKGLLFCSVQLAEGKSEAAALKRRKLIFEQEWDSDRFMRIISESGFDIISITKYNGVATIGYIVARAK